MTDLDTSFKTTMSVVDAANSMGHEIMKDGTQLFGRIPHRGPEAWLHIVYPPLNEADLTDLEG
jgi:hypothetical protein